MQTEALFFREIQTPLGSAVLSANAQGLSGFYFSDQRDCPPLTGKSSDQRINHPQAGEHRGLMLRRLKVHARSAHSNTSGHHELHARVNWEHGVHVAHSGLSAAHIERPSNQVPDTVLEHFKQATQELDDYFRGRLTHFSVPLYLKGTEFQLKVWRTLASLPMNELVSYGELGRMAGVSSRAYRAVGVAVGRNPLSIIVPCHRVVASNAQLTGYGGGLARKVVLLEHEGFRVS